MSKYGIDVSEHNGVIDWKKVSKNIEFCFLRAGYGNNNIDKRFIKNAKDCKKNNIPFGLYWFSYALNEKEAIQEAEYACNLADDYGADLGIAFDWEYDSDSYAKKKGVAITNEKRVKMADVFLKTIKARGYRPILYANPDYIHNKGFVKLINVYDLWLAQWGTNKPGLKCLFWQTSSQGSVNGINTNVDVNIAFEDDVTSSKDFTTILVSVKNKYLAIANDIIAGKYGVNEERKNKLKELGYDYEVAQAFVNKILGV